MKWWVPACQAWLAAMTAAGCSYLPLPDTIGHLGRPPGNPFTAPTPGQVPAALLR